MKWTLQPLTFDNLNDFGALLGSSDFGGCFCAVWTSYDATWLQRCGDPTQPNFAITKQDLESGRKPGFLVFADNRLAGWTGSGPKTEFPLLSTKLASRLSPSLASIWAIGCLAIAAPFRGAGASDHIVNAVIAQARTAGADIIEAYPTALWDEARSYRGAYTMYRRLGFSDHGRESDGGSEIALMQLDL